MKKLLILFVIFPYIIYAQDIKHSSAGLIGINTTPTTWLDIYGAGGATNLLYIYNDKSTTTLDSGFVFTNNGKMGIGTLSPSYGIHLKAEDSTNATVVYSYYKDSKWSSIFALAKSRGTIASPTAVLTGDTIYKFNFMGYNGTIFKNAARMFAITKEDWGTNNQGAEFHIQTSDTITDAVSDRIFIDQLGNVNIPNYLNALQPHGAYVDTTDQSPYASTKTKAITFNVTDQENGIVLAANDSVITATYAGKYLITFSAVVLPSASGKTFNIFLKKNNANYPMSSTIWKSVGVNQARIVTVTYIVTLAAGDNVSLHWWTDDASAKLDYTTGGNTVPAQPTCPSIIFTINKISN